MSYAIPSPTAPRVLMVSKPIAPPWTDSSKNLVRDLVCSLTRYQASLMTKRGSTLELGSATSLPVYGAGAGHYAPPLVDNARVLRSLLTVRQHALFHFFFAPNPRTSRIGSLVTRVRRMPSVQTVCSAPLDGARLTELLFADRTIVLSRATEQRVLAAGVPASRVRLIPPAVQPLEPRSAPRLAALRGALGVSDTDPLVVYPGDLEFSSGAECMVRAHARLRESLPATLVLACRAKTAGAQQEQRRIASLVDQLGLTKSTRFVGERSDIHDLLACADVVALPADSLYAKMDLPLVLIEAMMLGTPVVTSSSTPAAELACDDAALAVAPEPGAVAEAIAGLLTDAQRLAGYAARGQAAALARYEPARMARAYETVYDELVR